MFFFPFKKKTIFEVCFSVYPPVQVVMEIFLLFLFSLPAGGVVVCSITVNSVSEQKAWGDFFILSSTMDRWGFISLMIASVIPSRSFEVFFRLWIQVEPMRWCGLGHCPLSRDQPHTHISYTAFLLLLLLPHQLDEAYFRSWHHCSFHGLLFIPSVVLALDLIIECFLLFLGYISDTGHFSCYHHF